MSAQKQIHIGLHGPEKRPGWFSWRHATNQEHEAAKVRRLERVATQQAASNARDLMRLQRSPKEQLALLDRRLGIGRGAVKERARLKKAM